MFGVKRRGAGYLPRPSEIEGKTATDGLLRMKGPDVPGVGVDTVDVDESTVRGGHLGAYMYICAYMGTWVQQYMRTHLGT